MTEYGAAALNLNITGKLCGFLAESRFEDLPEAAAHAGRRGILDWIGCALAGSDHPTITMLISVLAESGGKPVATAFGRNTKLGLLDAPIANGQMGHMLDYDDTHMGGVVLHASSPILAALFALADRGGITGAEFLAAYAIGFEASVRAGQAAPGHHDGGWHLTGTLGSIAAGAAAGRVIGLDPKALTHALGIATTQAAGMQQNRGTMCKSFHAGKAAYHGVLAALLAEKGFDSSDEILEGKKGFCRIYSASTDTGAILDQLGTRWEIVNNGHKPYACGVVQHPAIDAMIALAEKTRATPHAVVSVALRVHPHAVSITGVAEPETGLKSKFSLTHSAAVAFIDRAAGIEQYSDVRAAAPAVVALRQRINVTTDDTLHKDQARATVELASGDRIEEFIEHAAGTVANPMTDAAIDTKFLTNAIPVIGEDRAKKVRDMIWQLECETDMRALTALCA
jgi:2-methylcitrate dehydratase PrpD